MCGICGVIHLDGKPVTERLLEAMNDTLAHRGPSGAGYFVDDNLGLAMRRLSIIDVAGSDQPLYNEDESIALVFNGEIYNFQDLRDDLINKGHRFRTEGDGETVAHLYEEYGADCFQHLRGMYAIALWDKREKRLLLARDRMGQKPLYYYQDDKVLVFASEIKAILKHPDVPRVSTFTNPPDLPQYLSYGYMPAPLTAFQGILMLMPANLLRLDADGCQQQPYWELPNMVGSDTTASQEPYILQLQSLLEEAVKLRLISDVPLGAFLSGGLDSSLIVALMRKHSNSAVKTFSIGFEGDDSFDETPYAKQVAQHLETDHTAFTVKPNAMDLLSDLVWHHDQPFADSSAIPTYLVSKLTREHVTVALTGDGGDELFAGYERFYAAQLMQKMSIIPSFAWKGLAGVIDLFPEGTSYYNPIKRAGRFAKAASQPVIDAYFDLVRVFSDDLVQQITLHAGNTYSGFSSYTTKPYISPTLAIVEANMRSYLPDDLLIKADRCSMQASLEARAPFLDHKLVEYAATIPFNLKLKGSTTKHILKESARGLLPDSIIDRKKHGFGVPLGAWLRKDIQPVRDILLSQTARTRGLMDMTVVERLISEHANGQRDHNRQLWTLLTLEEWHRQFIDPPKN
jgi:asparagine synthase (glutamine-hydrolysing)